MRATPNRGANEQQLPLGRFGGTTARHHQVNVTIPPEWAEAAGEELEVDELHAPLLRPLELRRAA